MKKILGIMLSMTSILEMFGCDNNNNESTSISASESESQKQEEVYVNNGDKEIKIEEVIATDFKDIINPTKISIDQVDSLYVNPFNLSYFLGEAKVIYPTKEALKDVAILYTSDWYSINTTKRDNVKEYLLEKDGTNWMISDIYDKSDNYIPLNQAVLSLPSSISTTYDIGDSIAISYSIPEDYSLSLYNQDNKRLVVKYINETYWAKKEVNMYDEGFLCDKTANSTSRLSLLNFEYDVNNKAYKVSDYRAYSYQLNQYTNINSEGFVLVSNIDEGNRANLTINKARFSVNDIVKADAMPLNEKTIAISPTSYTFADGTNITYSIGKVTSTNVSNKYKYEVSVDKNGYIVDVGCNVKMPTNGYKLVISSTGNSTIEKVSKLFDSVFVKSRKVTFKNNMYYVSLNVLGRATHLYNTVASDIENINDYEIADSYYDYDMDTIDAILASLESIENEIDSTDIEDANSLFRSYLLAEKLYKYTDDIRYAKIRNEAVQVKATWYITHFNGNDKDLESLQEYLDLLESSGINELIIYGVDDGKCLYANSKMFAKTKDLNGHTYGEYGEDYLKALIGEAHKRGMVVFTVLCPFTCGLELNDTTLASEKALNIDGKDSVSTSQGTVKMLDPASDKVQEAIKNMIDDVLSCNPDLDGIQLDYIRYGADNNQLNTCMGITENARVKFNTWLANKKRTEKYNTLAELRQALKNATILGLFNEFEQQLITNTVSNVKDVCKEYDKPLTVAAADEYSLTKTWKCQDWGLWGKTQLVDAIYIMDYYFDDYYVNYYFEDGVTNTSNKTMLVCGIDPSYAQVAYTTYKNIYEGSLESNNSFGYGIFGTHTQDVQSGWIFTKKANSVDSISPYLNIKVTLTAMKDKLLERANNIYLPYSGMTQAKYNQLENDLNDLIALVDTENYTTCLAALNKINDMLTVTYGTYANDRIKEQLTLMQYIARLKVNIYKD